MSGGVVYETLVNTKNNWNAIARQFQEQVQDGGFNDDMITVETLLDKFLGLFYKLTPTKRVYFYNYAKETILQLENIPDNLYNIFIRAINQWYNSIENRCHHNADENHIIYETLENTKNHWNDVAR